MAITAVGELSKAAVAWDEDSTVSPFCSKSFLHMLVLANGQSFCKALFSDHERAYSFP